MESFSINYCPLSRPSDWPSRWRAPLHLHVPANRFAAFAESLFRSGGWSPEEASARLAAALAPRAEQHRAGLDARSRRLRERVERRMAAAAGA